MKIRREAVVWIVLGALTNLGNSKLYAHHAFEAEFILNKPVHIEGKVVQIQWTNPHVYTSRHPAVRLHLTVAVSDGKFQDWIAESAPPATLKRGGWIKTTLAVGDLIQIDGNAVKDGSRTLLAKNATVMAVGETTLSTPRVLLGKLP